MWMERVRRKAKNWIAVKPSHNQLIRHRYATSCFTSHISFLIFWACLAHTIDVSAPNISCSLCFYEWTWAFVMCEPYVCVCLCMNVCACDSYIYIATRAVCVSVPLLGIVLCNKDKTWHFALETLNKKRCSSVKICTSKKTNRRRRLRFCSSSCDRRKNIRFCLNWQFFFIYFYRKRRIHLCHVTLQENNRSTPWTRRRAVN